jgi:hypothetical protein
MVISKSDLHTGRFWMESVFRSPICHISGNQYTGQKPVVGTVTLAESRKKIRTRRLSYTGQKADSLQSSPPHLPECFFKFICLARPNGKIVSEHPENALNQD